MTDGLLQRRLKNSLIDSTTPDKTSRSRDGGSRKNKFLPLEFPVGQIVQLANLLAARLRGVAAPDRQRASRREEFESDPHWEARPTVEACRFFRRLSAAPRKVVGVANGGAHSMGR
ncbi:MAG: hypothetical protein KY475_06705 [Planctomycetes bacterium]|nr:hypothetical protein [Planctomycetota bacterium]